MNRPTITILYSCGHRATIPTLGELNPQAGDTLPCFACHVERTIVTVIYNAPQEDPDEQQAR